LVLTSLFSYVTEIVRHHSLWAGPIAFVFAFAGSFVGTNTFVPAGFLLTSAAALIGPGMHLVTLMVWIAAGAALGSAVSYALGTWFGPRVRSHWPLKDRPELMQRAHALFERYGILAVFIGYFIGPLRGPIPVAAGVAGMRRVRFHLANVLSAPVWAVVVVAPAAILGESVGANDPLLLVAPLLVPALTLGMTAVVLVLRRVFRHRPDLRPAGHKQPD